MWRDLELAARDPLLQQPGIDVEQRGAAEAAQHLARHRVVQVQQQVGVAYRPLGAVGVRCHPLDGTADAELVEEQPVVHASRREPPGEDLDPARVFRSVAPVAQTLEPPHVTARLAQALDVLHVGPEVTAALEEARHVVRRDDHPRGAHGVLPASAAKPINSIDRDSIARRTRGSHSVRSSSSRSAA